MSPNFSSKLLSFRVGGALFSTSRLTSPGGEVMKRCFSISLAPLREVLEVRAWCASTRQEHGRVSPRVAEVGLTGTGMSWCKHTEVWAQVSAGSAHAGLPQAPLHSTNRSDDLQSCGCSGFLSNFAKANTNMLPPTQRLCLFPGGVAGTVQRGQCIQPPRPGLSSQRHLHWLGWHGLFLSCRPFSSHSWETHFGHH